MATTRPNKTVTALRNMAKEFGCENNALFQSTMEQYIVQQRVIDMIRAEIDKSDVAVSKEYVKGRENLYAHPLIKELPKHSDSANRTAGMILEIIKAVGQAPQQTDGFDSFLESREQM